MALVLAAAAPAPVAVVPAAAVPLSGRVSGVGGASVAASAGARSAAPLMLTSERSDGAVTAFRQRVMSRSRNPRWGSVLDGDAVMDGTVRSGAWGGWDAAGRATAPWSVTVTVAA